MEQDVDSPATLDETSGDTKVGALSSPLEMFERIIQHRGWNVRSGQRKMVQVIQDSLTSDDNRTDDSINAPVGTGKTFGYAIPAIASKRKTIITTSTKALQDQVIGTDLPALQHEVKQVYDYDFSYALLKGRSNYACLERVEAFLNGTLPDDDDDDDLFADIANSLSDDHKEVIEQIKERITRGMEERDPILLECGDLLDRLPPNVRKRISSASKCSGCRQRWWYYDDDVQVEDGEINLDDDEGEAPSRIPYTLDEVIEGATCPQRLAFALALNADILVVNTALLVAEMIKTTRGGMFIGPYTPQLLPGAGLVVIDEAHHLESILTGALSQELNFDESVGIAEGAMGRVVKRYEDLKEVGDEIPRLIRSIQEEVSEMINVDGIIDRMKLADSLRSTAKTISNHVAAIDRAIDHVDVDPSRKRDVKTMKRARSEIADIVTDMYLVASHTSEKKYDAELEFSDYIYDFRAVEYEENDNVILYLVPLDLSFFRDSMSEAMNDMNMFYRESNKQFVGMYNKSSIVLCSGTITRETAETVGLDYSSYLKVESPFDHKRSRIFIPTDLSNPNDDDYMDTAWEYIRKLIDAAGGRTLVATTSYAALTGVRDWKTKEHVKDGFVDMCLRDFGSQYNVLYQGNGMSRADLLDVFRSDEQSILLGTASFWEGVDVPGDSLIQMILHKAPFPMRDDPQIEARRKWVKRHGEQPFTKVDVNLASIQIGQGAGRLIRSEKDRGGIVFLDSRYWDKPYGDQLLGLLPAEIPITSNLNAYTDWIEWVRDTSDDEELPSLDMEDWRPLRKSVGRRRRRRSVPN